MRNPRNASVAPLMITLDKKLLAYAAAASASCVGVFATQAEAEIVFTKVNKTIDFSAKTKLDLNNDGIPDFNFAEGGLGHFDNEWIHPLASNQVVASRGYWASALPAGATVGPGGSFVGHIAIMQQLFTNSFGTSYLGPWANGKRAFLGLEITIDGKRHFGWARINFPSFGKATLTGYAYETVPGKAIVTGAINDAAGDVGGAQPIDASPFLGIPTLGLLARGADGLELWRRDEAML